jgi:hypothetical protein
MVNTTSNIKIVEFILWLKKASIHTCFKVDEFVNRALENLSTRA